MERFVGIIWCCSRVGGGGVYGSLAAERTPHGIPNLVGQHTFPEKEHHFCYCSLACDVVAGDYARTGKYVAGGIEVRVNAAIYALCHVQYHHVAADGITYRIREPLLRGRVSCPVCP